MSKRIKQFVSAITAKITEADKAFVKQHLHSEQAAFFWQMNLPDQRHALNVAYTALELAEGRKNIDRQLLINCALLHDIGKVKGDVSTLDKVLTVIFDKFAANWVKQWGRLGRGGKLANLRHAVYIYYNHAERGAAMLKAAGVPTQITEIVAKHHEKPEAGEPAELSLLKAADSLN